MGPTYSSVVVTVLHIYRIQTYDDGSIVKIKMRGLNIKMRGFGQL